MQFRADQGVRRADVIRMLDLLHVAGDREVAFLQVEGNYIYAVGVILDAAFERLNYNARPDTPYCIAVRDVLNDVELESADQMYDFCGIRTMITYPDFEGARKTCKKNYDFEEMLRLCNELKELSCFCELLNKAHEEGYPKEIFNHMRDSHNAMIDYFRNHGDVKTLEEAKNNLRTAKNFWFAPDFIQYFEAVKAQNAQWYCTGKNRLAKTWDKAPVVFSVGCLLEDYINQLAKEVPGMISLDDDWRKHSNGVVGLSLYDLSHETILFENKEYARDFCDAIDFDDLTVDFLVWKGDAANGRWIAWEE